MATGRNILLALRWYHPKIHRGVVRYAREAGWHLNAELARTQGGCEYWDGDGILTQPFSTIHTKTLLDDFLATLHQPCVLLGEHVRTRNDLVGQMAAEHFRDLGFRHVAMLDSSGGRFLQPRLVSFEQRAKQFASVDHLAIDELAPWPQRRASLLDRLSALPKPVAIFALDDDAGAWIIETCLAEDISIPDEVAVLGVRNDELVCDTLAVPLSSIENNLEELGYQAAALLDRHLDGEPLPTRPILVPPREVVVRQSTDILAIDHPQVLRAMQFIRRNLRQPFSVDDVVAATTMSQRGLYKAFETHLGRGIHQQILHERLRVAQRRLLAAEDTIDSIARQAGFADAQALHRIFKQHTGHTPRQWVAERTNAKMPSRRL